MLCLPRNLHFEVHHGAAPATRSALRGSTSAVPATKSELRGSPSAAPATKSALRGSPSAVLATKCALRGSPSAAPATKSALRGSPSAALATKSALRGAPATKSAHRGSQSAAPATKSANEQHVQKSRFTAPVTKSELPDDHQHAQSAAPAKKTALRSETAPIPGTCHEKSTLKHQNTRFPLRLPCAKMRTAHGTTTRAQSLEAPAVGPKTLRACAVKMHIDDVKRHECTANSSELAAQRSLRLSDLIFSLFYGVLRTPLKRPHA